MMNNHHGSATIVAQAQEEKVTVKWAYRQALIVAEAVHHVEERVALCVVTSREETIVEALDDDKSAIKLDIIHHSWALWMLHCRKLLGTNK